MGNSTCCSLKKKIEDTLVIKIFRRIDTLACTFLRVCTMVDGQGCGIVEASCSDCALDLQKEASIHPVVAR
jgi:hypothetical protein